MNLPSILIIDDEPDNFDVIETFLSGDAYELHYAASGREALDNLDLYNPDLILLDVMMPELNGLEVCQQIKSLKKWEALPIVMVTALSTKADLARCLNAGADDYISKPVSAIELRARVRSMLRIKQQYDSMQELLKLREDMVKMLLHDLRNPLSTVLLGLELLQTVKLPPEKQALRLSQIHSSAQMLQHLIEDLLQIALVESGKIVLQKTQINLPELVKSSTSLFEAIAAQKDQSIQVVLPESQPEIWGDFKLLRRTLDNLIANSIKFSPNHSTIQIELNTSESDGAIVRVLDEGKGVPEALREQIFKKYEVGTLMPEISQIGLGLAFCKTVVEAHQGQIGVQPNQPNGSIFEICLPAGVAV